MIWARVELQNTLKNGTSSTRVSGAADSLTTFISPPGWLWAEAAKADL